MEEKKKKEVKNQKTKTKKAKVKNTNKEIKAKNKDTKMKFKYKHPKIALALKIALIIFLILCVIGTGVVIGLIYGLWGEDFKIDIEDLALSENSVIVDSDGNIIAELTGDENRKIVSLEEMSPYLPKAYVAIEDERFEKHNGVDIKRTLGAIFSFVTHGGKSSYGGSTITQQLVKNITQDKEDEGIAGIFRKVKEWIKAYQIEQVLSKDQILELYLNLIFIGGNNENHGVEIASEFYFNKSSKDLSIAQCAFLAGINHAPNAYNPYTGSNTEEKMEKIKKRTKTVLSKMKELNYISQEEYDTAVAEVDAGFQFENGVKGNVYSSHTDALLTQLTLQIMEEKQISKDAATTYLYSGGLKIYSTQVSSIQTTMEKEATNKVYVSKSRENFNEDGTPVTAQAAMVVIDPKTGYVVGCIGQLGEKTTSRGLNRAVPPTSISSGTKRSPGSSFKPIADVLPAVEEGIITPATIYDDSYTIFNKGTANAYDPKNEGSYTGLRSVRSALTTSQNVPFVKIMAELGVTKSLEYLSKMGIDLDKQKDSGLSVSIGGLTYGVSVLEMAAAYASISNNGTYIEPTFYSKVEDTDGKIVLEPKQETQRVCSEDTAYIVKDLLTSVVTDSGATASYCAIKGIDVAAKTGTTNEDCDRWLCGFTNYYAAAAWYGFDVQEEVRGYARNPAGTLFDNVMSVIHEGLPDSKFEKTANIVTATICKRSGRLATDQCTDTYTEIFIKGHLPETCDAHQGEYTICTESGLLANEFCPASSRQTKSDKYIVEKEKLGIWYTANSQAGSTTAPTEYCTIHTKPAEVLPPETEEPEPEEPEEPSEGGDGGNTTDPGTGGEGGEGGNTTDPGESGDGNTTNPGDGGETGDGNNSENQNNSGNSRDKQQ